MIDKDKQQIQQTQDKVASYEHEFKKIQDATGITGIDELVNKFIEAEEKNYSLFNYVNTLASDIEKMEKDVAAIKKEVDTYKGHGVHSDSSRKQCVLTTTHRFPPVPNVLSSRTHLEPQTTTAARVQA